MSPPAIREPWQDAPELGACHLSHSQCLQQDRRLLTKAFLGDERNAGEQGYTTSDCGPLRQGARDRTEGERTLDRDHVHAFHSVQGAQAGIDGPVEQLALVLAGDHDGAGTTASFPTSQLCACQTQPCTGAITSGMGMVLQINGVGLRQPSKQACP